MAAFHNIHYLLAAKGSYKFQDYELFNCRLSVILGNDYTIIQKLGNQKL